MKLQLLTAAMVLVGSNALAQDTLSVVGSWSGLPLHKQ